MASTGTGRQKLSLSLLCGMCAGHAEKIWGADPLEKQVAASDRAGTVPDERDEHLEAAMRSFQIDDDLLAPFRLLHRGSRARLGPHGSDPSVRNRQPPASGLATPAPFATQRSGSVGSAFRVPG